MECNAAVLSLVLAVLAANPAPAQNGRHPVSGRAYASVMGVGGASWLERAERENEERPKVAVELLELNPGLTVADIGAGSGYYSELISRKVGPSGKVIASDIQPGMIRLLQQRVRDRKLSNVEIVLGLEDDPKLPAASIDLALMVDVYHEFSQPQAMLRKLHQALKPGGRLVLLEFRKEDPKVPIREEHKMSIPEVRSELEPEGFRFERVLNDLPWQHILIFRK
jgi:predicted methyltransferase